MRDAGHILLHQFYILKGTKWGCKAAEPRTKLISMSAHPAIYLSLYFYNADVYSEIAQSSYHGCRVIPPSPSLTASLITHAWNHSFLFRTWIVGTIKELLRNLSHAADICDSIKVGHIYFYTDISPPFPITSLIEQTVLCTSLYTLEHSKEWSASIY